jgi:glycosyltransferase involved in cell wall biosynthesis
MTSPNQDASISVILPVFNEELNLRLLIPQIYNHSDGALAGVEVIVVDDNSDDGTKSLMTSLQSRYPNLLFVQRSSKPSLSRSLQDGIAVAKSNVIAWMDADGSMPVEDLVRMVVARKFNPGAIVIGSRFVEGGGFKGINQVGSTSFLEFFRNVSSSNDSIVAVILSRILNKFLRTTIRAGVKDLTSGFILLDKSDICGFDFGDRYGEYFPRLIHFLRMRGSMFIEIGYVCLPRKFGVSKTGTSIHKLVARGIPYLSTSLQIVGENIRTQRARSELS